MDTTLRRAVAMLRQQQYARLVAGIRRRAYSERRYTLYELRLRKDLEFPEAKIPFSVRQRTRSDNLFRFRPGDLLFDRLTVWVGMTSHGDICFSQAMATPEDAEVLRSLTPALPVPPSGSVLVEGLYVAPRFRNLGVATAGLALVARQAKELGYEKTICMVETSNGASVRVHEKAGFEPYSAVTVRWRGFKCDVATA